MSDNPARLYLLCGKIASGKSTLAAQLAAQPSTLLISEDAWLSRLYPDAIRTLDDYIRRSRCLREAIADHVRQLLCSGVSVVLDFPANTPGIRRSLREISDRAGVGHELHHIDIPDEICKKRLGRRNADGTHEFSANEAEFEALTAFFVSPTPDEGLNVITHSVG